jgi:hypothetical protein
MNFILLDITKCPINLKKYTGFLVTPFPLPELGEGRAGDG